MLLRALQGARWRQYVLAAALGAIPGCLGAYAVVALYAHRKVSLGALVAAMIATSGDEIFVMLALFPQTALLLYVGLAMVGVLAAALADRVVPAKLLPDADGCSALQTHEDEDCRCLPQGTMVSQWRPPSPYRATLVVALALVLIATASNWIGPPSWGWKRITLMVVMALGLFVSATVPEHFLDEHLWRHVALEHVPRIFLWTLGALAVLALLGPIVDLDRFIATNHWTVLPVAAVVGIIPESGPHLAFVTMFSEKRIPLSVLVASSVVQDGHGMLPLLAASKRAFVIVKLTNLIVGAALGAGMLAVGY